MYPACFASASASAPNPIPRGPSMPPLACPPRSTTALPPRAYPASPARADFHVGRSTLSWIHRRRRSARYRPAARGRRAACGAAGARAHRCPPPAPRAGTRPRRDRARATRRRRRWSRCARPPLGDVQRRASRRGEREPTPARRASWSTTTPGRSPTRASSPPTCSNVSVAESGASLVIASTTAPRRASATTSSSPSSVSNATSSATGATANCSRRPSAANTLALTAAYVAMSPCRSRWSDDSVVTHAASKRSARQPGCSSWNDETSTTSASYGGAFSSRAPARKNSSAHRLKGTPRFPPTNARLPHARMSCPANAHVVLLPFVPVTASFFVGAAPFSRAK